MLDRDSTAHLYPRLVPGLESGTLRSRQAGSSQASFTDYALEGIKLKRLTEDQMKLVDASVAHLYRVLQTWKAFLDAASAPDPKANDIVTDSSGTQWVVEKVLEHKLLGNVWNLLVLMKR